MPIQDFAHLLEAPNTAVLTTIGPDGAPNSTPVWFLFRDGRVLVSTREGAQKAVNVGRDPRVSLAVVDPGQPERYVELRGRARVEPDPEMAVRDAVVAKHGYPDGSAFDPPGARRVSIGIEVDRVLGR